MKTGSAAVALLSVFFMGFLPVPAFHGGGSEYCESCHDLHGQEGRGDFRGLEQEPRGKWLLRGSDSSSTCLGCHAVQWRVLSDDGSAYTPGGDFFWLARDYSQGRENRSPGDSHGHNVVALDFRMEADRRHTTAPGDGSVTYFSQWLGCDSCHDPHALQGGKGIGGPFHEGSEGDFRLLGGVGYGGGSRAAGFFFEKKAPVARSYGGKGRDWSHETDANHTDYGSGMSEWCVNCHSGFTSRLVHQHPAGREARLGHSARLYNAYLASGDLTGIAARAFDRLVPFERGTEDSQTLAAFRTDGPDPSANVMCLTCHRAHASAFASIGRWDFRATFLAESPVLASPEGIHAYYGEDISRRYHSYQRSLCNKCHVRD